MTQNLQQFFTTKQKINHLEIERKLLSSKKILRHRFNKQFAISKKWKGLNDPSWETMRNTCELE
jgi:hypothetical protein